MQSRPDIQRLLIVNLDAHFDLRMAEQANSGTPFRQMQSGTRSMANRFIIACWE